MKESSAPETIVTFVHGTWARKSAWLRPDSALSRTILAELGPETQVKVFWWSGKNGSTHRLRAGENLVAHINKLAEQYPQAKQLFLCHSHGGNVFLTAMNDSIARTRVTAVTMVGTPFLHYRPRSFGPNGGNALLAMLVLPVIGTILLFSHFAPVDRWIKWTVAFILATVGRKFVAAGEAYLQRKRREMHKRIPWNGKGLAIQIVRVASDEAGAALATSHFILLVIGQLARMATTAMTWVNHLFYGRGTKQSEKVQHWLLFSLIYSILLLLSIGILEKVFHFSSAFLVTFTAYFTSATTTVVFFTVGLGFLAGVPLVFLLIVLTILFPITGLGSPLEGLLFDVSAESTPPGKWTVNQFSGPSPPPPEESMSGDTILPSSFELGAPYHSHALADPEAIQVIASWLSQAKDGEQHGAV